MDKIRFFIALWKICIVYIRKHFSLVNLLKYVICLYSQTCPMSPLSSTLTEPSFTCAFDIIDSRSKMGIVWAASPLAMMDLHWFFRTFVLVPFVTSDMHLWDGRLWKRGILTYTYWMKADILTSLILCFFCL